MSAETKDALPPNVGDWVRYVPNEDTRGPWLQRTQRDSLVVYQFRDGTYEMRGTSQLDDWYAHGDRLRVTRRATCQDVARP